MDFFIRWSGVIGLILTILTILGSFFVEYKIHFVNKMRKKFAIWFNKEAKIDIYLNYQTEIDFEKIKTHFKNVFREKGIKVIKSNEIIFVFNIDTYSITLTSGNLSRESKTVSVDIERLASGIKSLKSKLEDIEGLLAEVSKLNKETLLSLEQIQMNLSLPYKWEYLSLINPKDFQIKDYSIILNHNSNKHYESEVKVYMKNITITSDSWKAVELIIQNFM